MDIVDYYLHSIGPANDVTIERLKNIINFSLLSKNKQGKEAQNNFGNYLNGDDYISLLDLEIVNEYKKNNPNFNPAYYDRNSITLLIDKERVQNGTHYRTYSEYEGKKHPLTLGEIQVRDCVPSDYIVGIAVPDNFDKFSLLFEIINNSGFETAVCDYDGNILYNTIKNRYEN